MGFGSKVGDGTGWDGVGWERYWSKYWLRVGEGRYMHGSYDMSSRARILWYFTVARIQFDSVRFDSTGDVRSFVCALEIRLRKDLRVAVLRWRCLIHPTLSKWSYERPKREVHRRSDIR